MRKIPRPTAPAPPAPEVPRAPEVTQAPAVDIDAILARQAEVLTAHADAMVSAVRKEMRELTTMVVDSRSGKVKVDIERDRNGNMKGLVIERITAPSRRSN